LVGTLVTGSDIHIFLVETFGSFLMQSLLIFTPGSVGGETANYVFIKPFELQEFVSL
jgi:hypothetical protein